jgi:hypothetical protein
VLRVAGVLSAIIKRGLDLYFLHFNNLLTDYLTAVQMLLQAARRLCFR